MYVCFYDRLGSNIQKHWKLAMNGENPVFLDGRLEKKRERKRRKKAERSDVKEESEKMITNSI